MEPNCKMRSPTFKPYKERARIDQSVIYPTVHKKTKTNDSKEQSEQWNRTLTAWNDGDALATESTLRKAFSLVEISENISMAMSKNVN